MATNNQENQNFKQIEGDAWFRAYLPAISAGTVMAIVLLLAISCSKKSDNSAKITPPAAPAATSPAPSTTAAVVPEKPKKVKKHRPANATYVNGTYGVSFSYPWKYSLEAGEGKQSFTPVPANFVKPGAVEIASVEMPDSSYTDSDFFAGLLNVSVNPGMTVEECAQFVSTASDAKSADAKSVDAKSQDTLPGDAPKPETVKIGSNEFTVLEQMSGETTHQVDVKYFHVFKNGACYEFALDVETSRKADEDVAQVDRGKVFHQLSKILTSARIKDVELPGVANAEKNSSPTVNTPVAATPATDSMDEKAQVVTPVKK